MNRFTSIVSLFRSRTHIFLQCDHSFDAETKDVDAKLMKPGSDFGDDDDDTPRGTDNDDDDDDDDSVLSLGNPSERQGGATTNRTPETGSPKTTAVQWWCTTAVAVPRAREAVVVRAPSEQLRVRAKTKLPSPQRV